MAQTRTLAWLPTPIARLAPEHRIRLVTLVGAFLAWEFLAFSAIFYEGVFPSSITVATTLVGFLFDPSFYPHVAITFYELAGAFVFGGTLGVGLGIFLGTVKFLGRATEPYISGLTATPKIVFLPVVLMAFGSGPESKMVLGAVSAFFPVVLNTYVGVLQVNPVLVRVGKAFNLNVWQMLTKIYIPSLVRPILVGMRLGLGVSITTVLIGEIKMARYGLGYQVIEYYNNFQIPEMYAILVLIFIIVAVVNIWMGKIILRTDKGRASVEGSELSGGVA